MRFFTRPPRVAIVYVGLLLGGFAAGIVATLQVRGQEASSVHRGYRGRFVALPRPSQKGGVERRRALPEVDVIDIEGVRRLAGQRARVRGKIYRVGHAPKSDTYFLDFGPLRSSFTAVIFASAVDSFRRENIDLRQYEGKEVELVGRIEDDPKYGLEMLLENPGQIKRLDE